MNLQQLTQSEKILLAEQLWDSVAADEQLFPLTDNQKAELDERLVSYANDPTAGDSWPNVKMRISRP